MSAPWELTTLQDSTPMHTTSFLNTGLPNNRGTRHGAVCLTAAYPKFKIPE